LFGNYYHDFKAARYDLIEWLRERGSNGKDQQRIIGLALLDEAADRFASSVSNQAEFQALLADAHAYLAYVMQRLAPFGAAMKGKRQEEARD
jgi:hypothetical protein